MNKILIFSSGLLATFIGIVFLFGFRATPKIETTVSAKFDFTASFVFDFISDIEKYSERKSGMDRLEILERKGQDIVRWKEIYRNGLVREFALNTIETPKYFEVELVESSNKHRAVVSYEFIESQRLTEVRITEKGKIDNVFWRGLCYILGDKLFIKSEIKWLRVAIHDKLINEP